MPKRTNDFQKLITLIEKQLSSKNTKIVESKFLKDFRNNKEREVDIYIETIVNNHQVRIALECRDHQRKQGTTWIEQIDSKYQNLPIDKVIAVSKSGFYKPAYEVAKHSNIQLLTLEDAVEKDWVRTVKNLDMMFISIVRFKLIGINFETDKNLFEKKSSEIQVFNNQNKCLDNLESYSQTLLTNQEIYSKIYDNLVSSYDAKCENFKDDSDLVKAQWTFRKKLILKDRYKFQAQLKSISYKFKCEVNNTSIPTKKFSYNKSQVATITKEFKNVKLTMTVSESKEKEPTLAISMKVKNKSGPNSTKDIITTPLPTYDGPITLTQFVMG